MRNRSVSILLAAIALPFSLVAADKPEDMPPPPAHWKIPPAPVVPPAEVLKSFKTQPGYQLELVASEPAVQSPVQISFDADGRMWVTEMRGYMPNADGTGEEMPVGRISVLEDVDGDGVYEKSTVFLDGLVLPRTVMCLNGGALVAEPPVVWFCRDKDGDLKCDEKTEIAKGYASRANPEHSSNGLTWTLDNWVYSANHSERYRLMNGAWQSDKTSAHRALWGPDPRGYQVELITLKNGGHVEPSKLQRIGALYRALVGPQNADFESAEAAWAFFKTKTRAR